MPASRPLHRLFLLRPLAAALALACVAAPVQAEKADRSKNLVLEADRQYATDGVRGVTTLSGNAVVAQGTMVLRAGTIELAVRSDGYRAVTAIGAKGKPAFWRQKTDAPGEEFVEGGAERVEYDEKANTLRLVGGATLRRTRGGAVVQEVDGALLVWNNSAERLEIEGGTATPANPSGRVRMVLSPPADAASAPAPAASSAPLAPVRSLGERR